MIPGTTMATVNLMSMFGLHRRWRGAIVGHLAGFEMTSTEPNRRYAQALRRLGFDRDALHFYDEHVEADATHEVLAAKHLAGGLAEQDPSLADDILFGAAAAARARIRGSPGEMIDRLVGGQDVVARAGRPRAVGVNRARLAVSYVLPLRWTAEQQLDLTGYLHWLAENVEKVIVVDGSPEELFERHGVSWSPVRDAPAARSLVRISATERSLAC